MQVQRWVEKCLQKAANGAGNILSIRAEARGCNRSLEGEVVQEYSAAPVNKKGTAIFIYCQQQAPIRAEAQSPYL